MIQNNKTRIKKRRKKVQHRIKSKRKAMTRYEKLNLRVNLIGPLLTFVLVLLAFVELRNVIKQYNLDNERQKKANTITYLQFLHEQVNNTDESLLEIIKYYDIDNDSISIISCDSLEKILKENHPYRKQLNDLMIGFNEFAIGCREGFFDEMTAWSANYSMVVNVTKALIPYYELIEKECGYRDGQFKCCFLRIMAFRWEHDKTMGEEHNKMLKQLSDEAKRATNDSMPIIRRKLVAQ